jgi:ABC-type multidrug transport system fused ATPase/permease subunit
MTPDNPDYPVRLEIDYPQRLSRLLIFVKGLLAIPHWIALTFLGIAGLVVLILSWFAVLFTGRYPKGMFDFIVGLQRWGIRVAAYVFLLTDKYPPFTLADDPSYPVRLVVDYPEHIARWRPLVQWILVYPVTIALYLFFFLSFFAALFGWFAILFTGRMPQKLFNTIVVTLRWVARHNVYGYWMTEPYPPFVWA